jgi:hypothetical protein
MDDPNSATTMGEPTCHGEYDWRERMTLSLPVRNSTALLMGRSPHIPYADIPCAVLELTYLPDVHPSPVLTHLDLVVRSHPDPDSTFLQHDIVSRSDDPFATPLPPV